MKTATVLFTFVTFVPFILCDDVAQPQVRQYRILGQKEPLYQVDFEPKKAKRRQGKLTTLGKSVYKTNLALSLPLFSYDLREAKEASGLAKAGAGLFGLLASTMGQIPLYLGLDGSSYIGKSSGGLTEGVTSFARQIGMEECGQMAICDAHARYRDYGILALPILLFFPGSTNAEGQPASEWQEAALRGKAREECYSRYNCLINPMWILNFVMKTFVY